MRLLIIEDDHKMSTLLKQGLQEAGFDVYVAHDGISGLAEATSNNYSAIVLDIMLPKLDGWNVLRAIRLKIATPVILLTARDSIADRVKGLEAGADDYLIKPFAFVELLARVHAILRRGTDINPIVLKLADLELDVIHRCALRNGVRVELTSQEFALLNLLMQHIGKPMSRTMIAREVWGITFQTDTNIVEVAMRRLRAKVDQFSEHRLIHTLRGIGYVLEDRTDIGIAGSETSAHRS